MCIDGTKRTKQCFFSSNSHDVYYGNRIQLRSFETTIGFFNFIEENEDIQVKTLICDDSDTEKTVNSRDIIVEYSCEKYE